MADQNSDWGVTNVTIRYVAGDSTWELSLDPEQIDILVFNRERFEQINKIIGAPIPETNHLQPDGASFDGKLTPEEAAALMGSNGPPRRIGPREEGTSHGPACMHNQGCEWWCIEEHEQ